MGLHTTSSRHSLSTRQDVKPQDAWKRLQRMANQAGKGGGPSPKGMAGGFGGLILLGGALMVGNNALCNVDGGHRAIKYTRIGSVSKEIYSEGTHFKIPWFETPIDYDVRGSHAMLLLLPEPRICRWSTLHAVSFPDRESMLFHK